MTKTSIVIKTLALCKTENNLSLPSSFALFVDGIKYKHIKALTIVTKLIIYCILEGAPKTKHSKNEIKLTAIIALNNLGNTFLSKSLI